MRAPLRRLGLALFAASAAAGAQPQGRDESLRSWLAARFQADHAEDPHARYVAAFADLNGDGRPEALLYLVSSAYCGSGGCSLFILTPAGHGWRRVADMTIVNPPVRLLGSAHHGWRDLAVTVAGGGARAHEALIAFNGRAYPGNPSDAPALWRRAPGRGRIADGDRGRPVF